MIPIKSEANAILTCAITMQQEYKQFSQTSFTKNYLSMVSA